MISIISQGQELTKVIYDALPVHKVRVHRLLIS